MRLSVQGCLILWLCFSSFTASANYYWEVTSPAGAAGLAAGSAQGACGALAGYLDTNWIESWYPIGIDEPDDINGQCHFDGHLNGEPQSLNYGSILRKEGTLCLAPNFIDPDTGECRAPEQPEECYENGEIYDAEYGRCVHNCPEGQLNGVCLQTTGQNNDSCNGDSPDYKGFIDFGSEKKNLCTSQMQCEGGAFGVVNGTPACIPDEYGPPTCKIETVAVIDEYGYVCADPQDAPEPDQPPEEEPNTDTDGDGEPDEYQRENDPTSVDKGLDRVNEGVSETNEKLDGANNRLDKVTQGLDAVNDNLNEGLGTANQTLGEINEKLDGPDDGYSTEGLGDAPTFEASATRFRGLITENPTIQAVTTIPTIAENHTCPIWTIPATDYWSPMPLDVHCDILNNHRGLLSLLFIAAWTLAAVFVFLKA